MVDFRSQYEDDEAGQVETVNGRSVTEFDNVHVVRVHAQDCHDNARRQAPVQYFGRTSIDKFVGGSPDCHHRCGVKYGQSKCKVTPCIVVVFGFLIFVGEGTEKASDTIGKVLTKFGGRVQLSPIPSCPEPLQFKHKWSKDGRKEEFKYGQQQVELYRVDRLLGLQEYVLLVQLCRRGGDAARHIQEGVVSGPEWDGVCPTGGGAKEERWLVSIEER